jgi:FkbM family methyltransferase
MHRSSDSNAGLDIDRVSGQVSAARKRDRAAIALLDAYATLTRPLMQRGLYKACHLVGGTLWRDQTANIRLGPDAIVSFPASDPYWNRMLLRSYDHEPEMARFLKRLSEIDYGFVDCGANIGYWTVFVASRACGGGKPVLAVEASAPTFARLTANVAPHAGAVTAFHRAILDRSDVEVVLNDAAHEARGIAAAGEPTTGETVRSITIDDLLARQGWSGRPLVVKLDVEGVERQALAGMERALAQDALVIYEDHGSDPGHALTRHMLADRNLAVRLLLDEGAIAISDPAELDRHKKDETKGYNLTACQPGSRWLPMLEA